MKSDDFMIQNESEHTGSGKKLHLGSLGDLLLGHFPVSSTINSFL